MKDVFDIMYAEHPLPWTATHGLGLSKLHDANGNLIAEVSCNTAVGLVFLTACPRPTKE
jgi:hypothetical protein